MRPALARIQTWGFNMRGLYGITVSLSLWAVSSAPAWSWGTDGHRTVGMVADNILQNSPVTRDTVNRILMPIAKEALTRSDIDIGEGEPVTGDECTLRPVTIEKSYTQWANQQALTQTGKAGFRLAALLRAIFEPH